MKKIKVNKGAKDVRKNQNRKGAKIEVKPPKKNKEKEAKKEIGTRKYCLAPSKKTLNFKGLKVEAVVAYLSIYSGCLRFSKR
jgi:hypothetical protein